MGRCRTDFTSGTTLVATPVLVLGSGDELVDYD
jgi:hypothetical protein